MEFVGVGTSSGALPVHGRRPDDGQPAIGLNPRVPDGLGIGGAAQERNPFRTGGKAEIRDHFPSFPIGLRIDLVRDGHRSHLETDAGIVRRRSQPYFLPLKKTCAPDANVMPLGNRVKRLLEDGSRFGPLIQQRRHRGGGVSAHGVISPIGGGERMEGQGFGGHPASGGKRVLQFLERCR